MTLPHPLRLPPGLVRPSSDGMMGSSDPAGARTEAEAVAWGAASGGGEGGGASSRLRGFFSDAEASLSGRSGSVPATIASETMHLASFLGVMATLLFLYVASARKRGSLRRASAWATGSGYLDPGEAGAGTIGAATSGGVAPYSAASNGYRDAFFEGTDHAEWEVIAQRRMRERGGGGVARADSRRNDGLVLDNNTFPLVRPSPLTRGDPAMQMRRRRLLSRRFGDGVEDGVPDDLDLLEEEEVIEFDHRKPRQPPLIFRKRESRPFHPDPTGSHVLPPDLAIAHCMRRMCQPAGIRLWAHGARCQPRNIRVRLETATRPPCSRVADLRVGGEGCVRAPAHGEAEGYPLRGLGEAHQCSEGDNRSVCYERPLSVAPDPRRLARSTHCLQDRPGRHRELLLLAAR